MHLFHCPVLTDGLLALPPDEAHHASSVLRLKPGARIGLLDGRGTRAEGEITVVDRSQVLVNITARTQLPPERRSRIHLAVAPTKQIERFEWMLEKCTEIGVDRITPLVTARTERMHLRRDRLERVLVSAMKQSQRAWLPQLDDATALKELISGTYQGRRLFGWCSGERVPLAAAHHGAEDVLLLIGPEGDFTTQEAALMSDAGCAPVSLGEARLRTETAAVAACAWMNLVQQV